jgi:hypothetical protein
MTAYAVSILAPRPLPHGITYLFPTHLPCPAPSYPCTLLLPNPPPKTHYPAHPSTQFCKHKFVNSAHLQSVSIFDSVPVLVSKSLSPALDPARKTTACSQMPPSQKGLLLKKQQGCQGSTSFSGWSVSISVGLGGEASEPVERWEALDGIEGECSLCCPMQIYGGRGNLLDDFGVGYRDGE